MHQNLCLKNYKSSVFIYHFSNIHEVTFSSTNLNGGKATNHFELQDLLNRRTSSANGGLITVDIEEDGAISSLNLVLEPKRDPNKVRQALFIIQKHLDEWAGKDWSHEPVVDHIIPRSRGEQDNEEKLQLLCGFCNRTKATARWNT